MKPSCHCFTGFCRGSTLTTDPLLCLELVNRPFPSSLVPLFQNESKCETFHIKMSSACSFIFMQIKFIFIRMVSHVDSLWNRGTRELGNGLFRNCIKKIDKYWRLTMSDQLAEEFNLGKCFMIFLIAWVTVISEWLKSKNVKQANKRNPNRKTVVPHGEGQV